MPELGSEFDVATEWLNLIKNESNFIPVSGDSIRFNSPFTDPFDDQISLLIQEQSAGKYLITDQGYTTWNLEVRNVPVLQEKSTRRKILASILARDNIQLGNSGQIFKEVGRQEIAQTINDVLDAVMKISDLAFSSRQNTRSAFRDDVFNFLRANAANYSFDTGFNVTGKTKLIYDLDFVFHRSLRESQWTKLYTQLSWQIVEMSLGIWADTESYRTTEYLGNRISFNILVPTVSEKQLELVDNLKQHDIQVVAFDDRSKFEQQFLIAG